MEVLVGIPGVREWTDTGRFLMVSLDQLTG